jgi:formylmethanofuran dehydrogenase subunit C
MSLKLLFKGDAEVPLEVEGITPDAVCDKSLAEIEKIDIFHGNQKLPLAEFFSVEGDPGSLRHEWFGQLTGVHWIGAGMKEGSILIASDGGRHIGSEMQGGQITVQGDAGDWVGAEMKAGRIQVHGRAGHLIGAAYRGSACGMSGGEILIHGDVGNEIGHTMRRGLLAIGGNCGDLVGFNMLAGTILVWGESGIRHGAGMRRGTIGFMGEHHPNLLPSFRHGCRFQPPMMNLLLARLAKYECPIPEETWQSNFDLFHGDMIEGGRGEMLLRVL